MWLRPSRHAAAMLLAGALVAGCEPPPGLTETPSPPPPPPASPAPSVPVPVLPTPAVPPPTGLVEDRAVSCDGDPSGDEVLALLRTEQVLADDVDATIAEPPVCAGDWQYAVVSVPELDPLQVVTRGDPDDLELVTAGTEVCTVEVRVHAPPGIRTAAACVG